MIETNDRHHGGQIGLAALLSMLAITSCTAWMKNDSGQSMNWLPGWSQVKQNQQVILAKQTAEPAATFIVRFENEPVLDEICKNYRRDTAAAETKFKIWASRHTQLRGLRLSRASYSGELLLALPKNDPNSRTPSQILAALKSMDNIAYAEIDAIAQPGAGR